MAEWGRIVVIHLPPGVRLDDLTSGERIVIFRETETADRIESQRVTMETDAPELLRRCREDGIDAAVLVPN